MNRKVSGALFIAAGLAFFVAALMAEQRVFYGVGVAFIGVGIAFLIRGGKSVGHKG